MSLTKPSLKEWLAHVEAFKQSGLSHKDFCPHHGLIYHQFQYYYRHHYLKLPHTKKSKPSVIQKRLSFVPVNKPVLSPMSSKLELRFPNGVQCSLPLSIAPEQLRSLMAVLCA